MTTFSTSGQTTASGSTSAGGSTCSQITDAVSANAKPETPNTSEPARVPVTSTAVSAGVATRAWLAMRWRGRRRQAEFRRENAAFMYISRVTIIALRQRRGQSPNRLDDRYYHVHE